MFGWLAAYVAGIALVNVGFVYVPLMDVWGVAWPPMSLAVGLVFVLRDYAQNAAGHWVLAGMAAGCALSYLMASPYVAIASAAAFAISELADWALYTWSRRPFAQRVLISSAVSTPVDSAVFLGMIGFLSPAGLVFMTASKMLGAVAVWWRVR